MKKYIILVLIALLMGALFVGVVAAPAGKSNVGLLYLYEKDPVTWEIIEDGAWGKMKYNLSGSTFDFVFNGHGLDAGVDYTLIVYYGDEWPGAGICLGSGIVDAEGNIHIADSVDIGDLTDAKIWLVLSDDTDNCFMAVWNPAEYLFEEEELLTFDDTDVPLP